MGLKLSRVLQPASAASGTKAASTPRKRYGFLKRHLSCFTAVAEPHVEVITWFGRFSHFARPGFSCVLCCFGQSAAGRLNTALQHQEVQCECKTQDGVFVQIVFSIQYRVAEDRMYEAYYSMADPDDQVTSYVLDSVSTAVSRMTVEELFQERGRMVDVVRDSLGGLLHSHGFKIEDCLITVLTPTAAVKDAMSNVLATRRNREAAVEQGEADKLRSIKAAEASAESKYLQGQGLARFLVAFAAGSRDALRVLLTGRIRAEDLAFPEAPARDDRAALAAAGVEQLPAPQDHKQQQQRDAERQEQAQGSAARPGGDNGRRVQVAVAPAPVSAPVVPTGMRRKAPLTAGATSALAQPLLGDHDVPVMPAGHGKHTVRVGEFAPSTPSRAAAAQAARSAAGSAL